MAAILMEESFWANSQFSLARYNGEIMVNIDCERIRYIIVNKEGKDIFELSTEAEKSGRMKAIEPGEPSDLVDSRYIPAYRMMGRDAFIRMIVEHDQLSPERAMELAKEFVKSKEK